MTFQSGTLKQQFEYKSFTPSLINPEYRWSDSRIDLLLEEANRKLGELNAYSKLIPDVDFFIHMHVMKEATSSSRIEGTRTNIDEAILPEEEINPEKKDDWLEVQSYTAAMNYALHELRELPLSIRLLKNTHQILLSKGRGQLKTPGEIRKSQNWVGGASLCDAIFIPPHQDELPELLSDLEEFWHRFNIQMPHLIRNDLDQWLLFFLVGVKETSEKGKQTFQKIIELRHRTEDKIMSLGRKSKTGKKLLAKLFSSPAISVNKAMFITGLTSHQAANTLVNDFTRLGILRETTGLKRNRMFLFKEYLDLFS